MHPIRYFRPWRMWHRPDLNKAYENAVAKLRK